MPGENVVLRQKWSRGQVETRPANMPPCLIGMEACVGAHHLSRRLKALGHDARLMPAKYVRPYSKGQKNDFRAGEAIAEAVQRLTITFVATKTAEQLDLQAFAPRARAAGQPAHWRHQSDPGLSVGARHCRTPGCALPAGRAWRVLATHTDVLSPRTVHLRIWLATGAGSMRVSRACPPTSKRWPNTIRPASG